MDEAVDAEYTDSEVVLDEEILDLRKVMGVDELKAAVDEVADA
jgi:hypothetical protein